MKIIRKTVDRFRVAPNLLEYDTARAAFDWTQARTELDGLPGGAGLNIAHEAVVRHARGARARTTALQCLGAGGAARNLTYAELDELSSRFANALAALGVLPGERVFALLPRVAELYVVALGTWKARAVFCPLFSAFGPEPIKTRMTAGDARVVVTTAAFHQRKIAPLEAELPDLAAVILIDIDATRGARGVHSLQRLLDQASASFTIAPTPEETPALLHFTSGTTGAPKGAVHVHGAVLAHHVTGRLALDLHDGDVFWCTADPGWVTGTSYGIVAPLTNGVTLVIDREEFDAVRWYRILAEQRVNVWYTAPTAIRMLIKAGVELARRQPLPHLRFAASVGEPLDPEGVLWGEEALGVPFHDNWWQTETGGIMIANFASMDIKPGSMGKPIPGVEAAIVRSGSGDSVDVVEAADTVGELALRPGWPSMFRGYLGQDDRYRKCFKGGWYLSGDLARRDADGYYWFVGRADDVIKSAGHLIGPFEVESALLEHPAVAEAGVIGKPDATIGAIVKAFVALHAGVEATDALRRELVAHARRKLGPAVAPREIDFVASLPKTRSGKIMRRLLKARELGLPEGDTSMLEAEPSVAPVPPP